MLSFKPCSALNLHVKTIRCLSTSACRLAKTEQEDFRLLKIRPQEEDFLDRREKIKREQESRKRDHVAKRPRHLSMKTDQDWTNVWPTAKSFNWSVVPLPVRQGAIDKPSEAAGDGLPPEKKVNLELMKIPNFLHLTPRHIHKHCKAIKPYCTEWPKELVSDQDVDYHFPVEVVTHDYCFSAPSVRDPRARVVTVKYKLSELELDKHARDKYLKLVGSRYNPKTGEVTLVSDRCPLRKQNLDYIQYLMTALYFESWKKESWEEDITEEDHLDYSWDMNQRRAKILSLLQSCKESDQLFTDTDPSHRLEYLGEGELTEDSVSALDTVQRYGEAVEDLYNEGENFETITNYKQAVMAMLNVKTKSNTDTQHG